MPNDYFTPPHHQGFVAKTVFSQAEGFPLDGALAFIEPGGGGPEPIHTHDHDHLFFVVDGTATIVLGDETMDLGPEQAALVPGRTPHGVFNRGRAQVKMLGITLNPSRS